MDKLKAEFSQNHNDMYWKIYTAEDGFVRWTGYDDGFWWDNVSIKPEWQTRAMSSGKTYQLDPVTCDVLVKEQAREDV